jgi:hypothetical protein
MAVVGENKVREARLKSPVGKFQISAYDKWVRGEWHCFKPMIGGFSGAY